MNKYLSMLVALVVTLFTVNAMAFTAPPAPAKGWYVYDGTGKMTATEVSALNNKIKRISDATKNELGIAFLQSLDGADIADAANATFRNWGIGRHGLDNGVLIMLSLKEHKSRIETGKGVGGEITDLQAKQILDSMRPSLRSGNFFAAFNQALDQTSSLLDSRVNARQQLTPMVNPTQAQQEAANRLAQQQNVPQPYHAAPVQAQPNNPDVQPQQSSGGMSGVAIFLLVLLGLGLIGVVVYFFVRSDDDNDRYTRSTYTPPPPSYDPPARTIHTYDNYTPAVPSTRLTPAYTPPAPVYMAPPPPPVEDDNSSALAAAAAAAALLEEERENERRREREREREEERREARAREREREEERQRERRREEESSSSSTTSSFDWGSSSGGSDSSGGGFSGGDSGGGGASSDW